MWRRLKNIFHSLSSYADLSPDLQTRQRVNRFLRHRHSLSSTEWFAQFWQDRDVHHQVADFAYQHLADYSGLDFSRVYPQDRLVEDLKLPLVCWFDWEFSLCNDFLEKFGIDMSDRFDSQDFVTVEDLMLFLNAQLLSVNHFNGH